MKQLNWKKGLKSLAAGALTVFLVVSACSCGSTTTDTPTGTDESGASSEAKQTTGQISVISREDGSGTRSAFTELVGIVDENDDDATTLTAEITSSTSVMLTTVASNPLAIGYVSMGSLSNEVKALKIDGVEATPEKVLSGEYSISRPFLVVYDEAKLSDIAKDLIKFIQSKQGQEIVANEKYISHDSTESYTASALSGKITVSGSTSVAPLMEKLAEAYEKLNPDVKIEIQQTGSSAGITAATEGASDLGMSSRALSDSEAAKLKYEQIATDGIAVIVNLENTFDGLTTEQVKNIYLGETTAWDEVQK